MRIRVSMVLTGVFVLGLGCSGGKSVGLDDSGSTDDTTSSNDDSATTDDSTTTDDTSFGETFDSETPSYRITMDTGSWEASGGFYVAGATSYLKGELNTDPQQTFDLEIAGNIKYAGTYEVTAVRYSSLPGSDLALTSKDLDPDLTVTVLGFADGTELFAELSGTASLTGDWGEHTVTEGTFRSWPSF